MAEGTATSYGHVRVAPAQRPLHGHHVDPAAELHPRGPQRADHLEPQAGMHADRPGILRSRRSPRSSAACRGRWRPRSAAPPAPCPPPGRARPRARRRCPRRSTGTRTGRGTACSRRTPARRSHPSPPATTSRGRPPWRSARSSPRPTAVPPRTCRCRSARGGHRSTGCREYPPRSPSGSPSPVTPALRPGVQAQPPRRRQTPAVRGRGRGRRPARVPPAPRSRYRPATSPPAVRRTRRSP